MNQQTPVIFGFLLLPGSGVGGEPETDSGKIALVLPDMTRVAGKTGEASAGRQRVDDHPDLESKPACGRVSGNSTRRFR